MLGMWLEIALCALVGLVLCNTGNPSLGRTGTVLMVISLVAAAAGAVIELTR